MGRRRSPSPGAEDGRVVLGGRTVVVESSDGLEFRIDEGHLALSEPLQAGAARDKHGHGLLVAWPACVLGPILGYLEHHSRDPVPPPRIARPLRSLKLADLVADKWDAVMIDELWQSLPRQSFYDLCLAARDLAVPALVELAVARIAAALKGRPLCMLRRILQGTTPPAAAPEAAS